MPSGSPRFTHSAQVSNADSDSSQRLNTSAAMGTIVQDVSCTKFRLRKQPLGDSFLCIGCRDRRAKSPPSDLIPRCRFEGVRRFLPTGATDLLGGTFTNVEEFDYKVVFSERISRDEYFYLCTSISAFLLPWVQDALNLVSNNGLLIARPKLPTQRDVCDKCQWSLFLVSWICEDCGMDFCERCIQGHTMSACCCGGRLSVVSVIDATDLKRLKTDILSVIEPAPRHSSPLQGFRSVYDHGTLPTFTSQTIESRFEEMWDRGLPLMVTDLIFQMGWSPQDLVADCENDDCVLVNCEAPQDEPCQTTLADFLSKKINSSGPPIYKIKEHVPTTPFRKRFPERFQDIELALPMKNYTSDRGVLNIANLFPINCDLMPDLGPTLHMAMATKFDEHHHGTTRLRTDVFDVVNVMVSQGEALWHIFRHENIDGLWRFLYERFRRRDGKDPIHSQDSYLNPSDLLALERDYRIRPLVVTQTMGTAVFIPAGCAYQVANITPCIRINKGFLSPQSLSRANKVSDELHRMNARGATHPEALEFRNLMLHSWFNLARRARSLSLAWAREPPRKRQRLCDDRRASYPRVESDVPPIPARSPQVLTKPSSARSLYVATNLSSHDSDQTYLASNSPRLRNSPVTGLLSPTSRQIRSYRFPPAPEVAAMTHPVVRARPRPHAQLSHPEHRFSTLAQDSAMSSSSQLSSSPEPRTSVEADSPRARGSNGDVDPNIPSGPSSSRSSPQPSVGSSAASKPPSAAGNKSKFVFSTFNVAPSEAQNTRTDLSVAQGMLNFESTNPQWVPEVLPKNGQRRERHCVTCGGTPRECPGTQNQARCRKRVRVL